MIAAMLLRNGLFLTRRESRLVYNREHVVYTDAYLDDLLSLPEQQ